MLRRALWNLGLRYRKNVASLVGKPDVVFPASRIVVFCDGDFWHGRSWRCLREQLKKRANASYWVKKIAANRERDRGVTASLRTDGWAVIRVWESDVRKDPAGVAARIGAACRARSKRQAPDPPARRRQRS